MCSLRRDVGVLQEVSAVHLHRVSCPIFSNWMTMMCIVACVAGSQRAGQELTGEGAPLCALTACPSESKRCKGGGGGGGGGRERVAKAKSEKSKGMLTGNKLEIVTRKENVEGNKAMADAKASKKTAVEDGCI